MTVAEQSVIGLMVVFPKETARQVLCTLTAEMFEAEFMRKTFSIIAELVNKNQTPDIVTVSNKYPEGYKAEWIKALMLCCEIAPSLDGLENYMNIVREDWRIRDINNKVQEIALNSGSSSSMLHELNKIIEEQGLIEQQIKENSTRNFLDSAVEFYDDLLADDTSMKSGWYKFDRITGGLQRKSVYVIAARPGGGKTDFALHLAVKLSVKYQVCYNSMEMPRKQLLQRVFSRVCKINSNKLRDKQMTEAEKGQILKAMEALNKSANIVFDEQQRLDIMAIETKILKYKPDILFIDHLGLMKHPQKKNQWEAVSETTHQLKELALKHDIAIVELVQQKRETDSRKANLGDLYGGASVEQDADGVFMLQVEPFDNFLSGDDYATVQLQVKKNRHGELGDIELQGQPQYHHYAEADRTFVKL